MAASHTPTTAPVLVVDAELVGLCVALNLAQRGVPALVVDRSDGSIAFCTIGSWAGGVRVW